MSAARQPLVIPKTSRRELLLGLIGGLVIIAVVVYGLLRLSGSAVDGTLTGTITAKHYTAHAPETQISVGSSGLKENKSAGDYTFTVQVPATKIDYTVWVSQAVFDARNVGDSFSFPRPVPSP